MSHITHLYHLSAPDFIDFTTGIVPMSPWTPSYTSSDLVAGGSALGQTLILNYVEALRIRRLVHTASALFSGRHPIQNAMVPGGVTSPNSATVPLTITNQAGVDLFGPWNMVDTKTKFTTLLNSVRNFIDNTYIPNVVTVATHTNFRGFWTQGVGCGNVLAYGEYPLGTAGQMLIKRGVVLASTSHVLGAFDQNSIVEHVGNSWYDYPATDGLLKTNGRHPFDGVTVPHLTTSPQYIWLKAPRYGTTAQVLEVGPLARVWASYLSTDQPTVLNSYLNGYTLTAGNTYSISGLVNGVLGGLSGFGITSGHLFSALGRHAARALEAKLVADACATWINVITNGAQCYTYKKIPKTITTGYGLAEAPRGALGHWIKIEGRKVAKYQCVVPSTWNFSPKDNNATPGPVEQSLIGSFIGADADPGQQIVNILRLVHPFDCCIACAVHVVGPDGKEKLRFAIDPDGRPKNIKIAE